jgi:hypothetical protein
VNPRAWLTVAALAAAFWAGSEWTGARMQAQHDQDARNRAETAAQALEKMTAERDALALRLQARDDAHAKTLKGLQDETNSLRDCLRSGLCRLGVRVASPVACSSLPGPSAGSGVDTGSRAELAPDLEPAYFALRDGIGRTQVKLAACQDQLRERSALRPALPSANPRE